MASSDALDPLERLRSLLSSHQATLSQLASALGAPSRHVEDRIASLHRTLVSTIDLQRTEAEAEVALVRDKVTAVERDIASMTKALGHDSTSSRDLKEPLHAALERLEHVQADLQTAHAARVSQFEVVWSRFRDVLAVLGPDFSKVKPPPAGSSDHADTDLRITTLGSLEKELDRCQQELERRTAQFEEHLAEVLSLWSEMGILPGAPGHAVSAAAEFDRLMVAHLTPDDATRLDATLENLSRAQTARDWLGEEKKRREQLIQDTYNDLFNLWNKLGVGEEEQDRFLETFKGLTSHSVDAYVREKERMIQLKSENMAVFIQNEREDIQRLRNEIFAGEAGAVTWQDAHSHLDGDDLLEAFEIERKRLEGELQRRASVLIPLTRYFTLLAEVKELAVRSRSGPAASAKSAQDSAKDPTRFQKKGDPGRLLREEKMRKRHAKEKPRLEADLLVLIRNWEDEHAEPFLVNGTRYLDELSELAAPKKSAIPPRSKTPALAEVRSKTPAAGERSKTPAPKAATTAEHPIAASTAKRAGTAYVAATPTVAKRPRANHRSAIKPLIARSGNMEHSTIRPLPAKIARAGGGIPQLVYPAISRQISREWKPRPSITSLASAASSDSLNTALPAYSFGMPGLEAMEEDES